PQAIVGGKLIFYADDGWKGFEPWVSDGTADGTQPLGDLNPGAASSEPTPYPTSMLSINGKVIFLNSGILWSTDGTPAGTTVVSGTIGGTNLGKSGNQLIFNSSGESNPQELWQFDTVTGSL